MSILSVIILGYSPDKIANGNFLLGFLSALVCVLGWSLESIICAYGMKDDEISSTQALQIRQFVSSVFYGIQIIPIIPIKVNSFPNRAQPNSAAEIGSNDESIEPCTAPMRRTPSI